MSGWPYNTQRWQRLRKLKLQENPLCEACLQRYQRVEPAIAVDHIVPVKAPGGMPYPPLSGLRSLCTRCHNHKTRYEQLGVAAPVKGCDVHGRPFDPNHHWNRK